MAFHSAGGAGFYEAKYGKQPHHFVPVNLTQSDYERRIAEHLFVTDGLFGRMLVLPSFEPEFCISVHADIPESSIKKHGGWWMVPDEEKTYVITVTTASESLWYSMAHNNEKRETRDVKIAKADREISLDLTVAIQRVWAKALQLTRYPSGESAGLDGTTFQFSVWVRGLGELHGKTWSPDRGLPRNLTGLGLDLAAFVRQDAKGKQMTEEQLIKRLKKLESTIPKVSR